MTSPYGKQLHHQENVASGQFAFTSKESGNFMACFWLQNAPPNANVNLALDWKTGVGAKDWASIAKKDKLEVFSFSIEDAPSILYDSSVGLGLHGRTECTHHPSLVLLEL